jgi:hypothetical protein
MDPMKIEPRSDFRQGASVAYELYVAMIDAGFTEAQAMQVVISVLVNGQQPSH